MLLRPTHRMLSRIFLSLICGILVLAGGSYGLPARSSGLLAPTAFARAEFQQLWTRADQPVASGAAKRSWLWGPTPGAALNEPYASEQGTTRSVQYFDKARMELNPAVTDPTSQWRVTTGLLVSEMVQGRVQTGDHQFFTLAPSNEAIAGDRMAPTNPRYADFARYIAQKSVDRTGQPLIERFTRFGGITTADSQGILYAAFVKETAHNIPDVFLKYLTSSGPVADDTGKISDGPLFDWVYVMGYPISEPYWVDLTIDGKSTPALAQLYQRRALTYVPDFPQGWQVQMGNVGQHYYSWRYGSQVGGVGAPPSPPLTQPTPTAGPAFPATGGFVGIDGNSFTYRGSKVKLKGTNYWLSNDPFVGTWSDWNGPQVAAEMKRAHDMGVNTVRVGIPFDHLFSVDVVWAGDKSMRRLGPKIIEYMNQMLQIAGSYNMKVIVVLFEWYDKYPSEGSNDERPVMLYLQGIVSHFANDDRLLAWDLHNEPDNYDTWQLGDQSKVIKWLQRMAGVVRSLDSRHPITVGMGNYKNLWTPASDGTTILSFTDFAAFHCYDAGTIGAQIAETKARTQKPVLLEEMGWPTAPGEKPPPGAVFSEAQQNFLYTTMLKASKDADIAGVVQWTLFDFPAKSTTGGKFASYEESYGLVRLDGSLKPAAAIFKNNYTVPELPSDTVTNSRLTREQ